jgi:hypothetical protein
MLTINDHNLAIAQCNQYKEVVLLRTNRLLSSIFIFKKKPLSCVIISKWQKIDSNTTCLYLECLAIALFFVFVRKFLNFGQKIHIKIINSVITIEILDQNTSRGERGYMKQGANRNTNFCFFQKRF